ncbi:MAG: hypothetical protein LBT66_00200 [Methanobrevibacter sp.]|jgi:hypothetical protein|nr:hypothetical protein [Candidatus Methanovirga meridionalis]
MVKKTGLGKGLDALIPIISEKDLKNDISLEDILNKNNDLKKDNENQENLIKENDIDDENIKEVIKIIEKNPRITLWSSKSAAVLKYLRKTKPEFSISKEASLLMDKAISNKYPEIWKLFENIK